MITIEMIAYRNTEWIKMATYLGSATPEDIVQEMYLKLLENPDMLSRIEYKTNEVNTFYIFSIIRSKIVDAHRKESRESYDELQFDPIESPDTSEFAYQDLMESIKRTIDTMGDYDQMLLELHFVYKLSMRDIEERTGIPLHSIFNRLKNIKQTIKYQNYEQYKDYQEANNAKEAIARVGRYHREGHEGNGN
jgi:RNA polymerase sigma factor (sigma-70 family)